MSVLLLFCLLGSSEGWGIPALRHFRNSRMLATSDQVLPNLQVPIRSRSTRKTALFSKSSGQSDDDSGNDLSAVVAAQASIAPRSFIEAQITSIDSEIVELRSKISQISLKITELEQKIDRQASDITQSSAQAMKCENLYDRLASEQMVRKDLMDEVKVLIAERKDLRAKLVDISFNLVRRPEGMSLPLLQFISQSAVQSNILVTSDLTLAVQQQGSVKEKIVEEFFAATFDTEPDSNNVIPLNLDSDILRSAGDNNFSARCGRPKQT